MPKIESICVELFLWSAWSASSPSYNSNWTRMFKVQKHVFNANGRKHFFYFDCTVQYMKNVPILPRWYRVQVHHPSLVLLPPPQWSNDPQPPHRRDPRCYSWFWHASKCQQAKCETCGVPSSVCALSESHKPRRWHSASLISFRMLAFLFIKLVEGLKVCPLLGKDTSRLLQFLA